jgi:hypothetical protein
MIQQVYGPKNAFSKLMDLSGTFLQVDGPPMHFTLYFIFEFEYRKHRTMKGVRIDNQEMTEVLKETT